MKKWIAIIFLIVVIIVAIVLYKYNSYKTEALQIQKLNEEYEQFIEGDIIGTSLITLINKSIDLNQKNNIQMDNNNYYIENDTNSIKIDIKFSESKETYQMEQISKLGSEQFIRNYGTASFKCIKKEYHKNTNAIKYMLFEQIQQ